METLERVLVTGKFVQDDETPIPNFTGTIDGSRSALALPGWYVDLGPIPIRIDDTGEVKRLEDGELVPLRLIVPTPEQPFHYDVVVSGYEMDEVVGAVVVSDNSEIDLPTALRETIPPSELPEWLRVREEVSLLVEDSRQFAIDAESARDGMVVGGSVIGDDLILETLDGSELNAGHVRGKTGVHVGDEPPEDPNQLWVIPSGFDDSPTRGEPGPPNSLRIGTVEEGEAAATITGDAPFQTLNLWLPSGGGDGTIRGEGFPTHEAEIGDKYIDTLATNGAVEWMYTHNGWDVTVGDTGYRRISYAGLLPDYSDYEPVEGVQADVIWRQSAKLIEVSLTVRVSMALSTYQYLYPIGVPLGTLALSPDFAVPVSDVMSDDLEVGAAISTLGVVIVTGSPSPSRQMNGGLRSQ